MIGQHIGQYEIKEIIGQGGMATVYRAHQANFDRDVAIKVLSGQLAEEPTFVKRFQREAKVIARIEHPSIVPIYDYGEVGGLYFIVMRLMEGGTLRKLMHFEQIDMPAVARIVEQVGAALDHAHQHSVIHRDLKPSNILLDDRGNAYLTDFGIAKLVGSSTQVTQSGVVGTPSYMSPEQCQGKTLGAASDQYALGAILFELLTGHPPYEAETPLAVMYMHVRDPIPSPRVVNGKISPAVERVIMKALAKRPNERYTSCARLAAAFRDAIGGKQAPKVKGKPAASTPLAGQPATPQSPIRPAHIPAPATAGFPQTDQPGHEERYVPDRRPPLSRGMQTFLAGVIGVVALLGVVGAGLFGLSWLDTDGTSALAPGLPPTFTPTANSLTTTPFDGNEGLITPTSDLSTPTRQFPPTFIVTLTPTFTPAPPSNTPPPTAIPSDTPVPTATPIPPTITPSPTNAPPAGGSGRIAYTEGQLDSAEIVIVDTSGNLRRQITANSQYDGEPDWSPSGTRIAYEAKVGTNTDIYTMNPDGSEIRRVTTAGVPDRHPDWSPNGQLIAYESGEGEATEIYVASADGATITQLTNNGWGDRAPQFSPDGARIAVMTRQRGRWEIAILSYPGGSQTAIFDCPAAACRFPAWSPDGSQIAFNTLDASDTERDIWLLTVATGQMSALIQIDHNGRPCWSADGRFLFFNREAGTNTDLYRLNLLTGEVFRMTSGPLMEFGPDWGP